jgi:hypothetical protein
MIIKEKKMAEEFGDPIAPEEGQSKNYLWIIIAVVVVVLLCCCCFTAIGGKWLWDNGDQLLEDLGLAFEITYLFL